jgi:hypothetical protein
VRSDFAESAADGQVPVVTSNPNKQTARCTIATRPLTHSLSGNVDATTCPVDWRRSSVHARVLPVDGSVRRLGTSSRRCSRLIDRRSSAARRRSDLSLRRDSRTCHARALPPSIPLPPLPATGAGASSKQQGGHLGTLTCSAITRDLILLNLQPSTAANSASGVGGWVGGWVVRRGLGRRVTSMRVAPRNIEARCTAYNRCALHRV